MGEQQPVGPSFVRAAVALPRSILHALVEHHLDVAERLIAFLDATESDADLEPECDAEPEPIEDDGDAEPDWSEGKHDAA
jgi:hypothetical protein